MLICREKMISMAIRSSTIPPAMRNASTEMLKSARSSVPIRAKMTKSMPATSTALLALTICSFWVWSLVRVMNMGTVANGSKMKNSNVVA